MLCEFLLILLGCLCWYYKLIKRLLINPVSDTVIFSSMRFCCCIICDTFPWSVYFVVFVFYCSYKSYRWPVVSGEGICVRSKRIDGIRFQLNLNKRVLYMVDIIGTLTWTSNKRSDGQRTNSKNWHCLRLPIFPVLRRKLLSLCIINSEFPKNVWGVEQSYSTLWSLRF